MNASEIEYLEARLPVGLSALPSPEQVNRLIAKARAQRAQEMAAAFARVLTGLASFAREVRKIAVSCSAARLRLQHI
jgi:hypothetical protein